VTTLIASERLELPLLTRLQLERLAAGDAASLATELNATIPDAWRDDLRRLAAYRARQLAERPQDAPWLLRAIVRTDTREVIGYLNFHAGPDERGMVEIGYTLLPAARGQGYAIEAVRAATDWAARTHGIKVLRASVAPDNERSLNLIRKLGMVKVGEQMDPEDGLEHVYEREMDETDA